MHLAYAGKRLIVVVNIVIKHQRRGCGDHAKDVISCRVSMLLATAQDMRSWQQLADAHKFWLLEILQAAGLMHVCHQCSCP